MGTEEFNKLMAKGGKGGETRIEEEEEEDMGKEEFDKFMAKGGNSGGNQDRRGGRGFGRGGGGGRNGGRYQDQRRNNGPRNYDNGPRNQSSNGPSGGNGSGGGIEDSLNSPSGASESMGDPQTVERPSLLPRESEKPATQEAIPVLRPREVSQELVTIREPAKANRSKFTNIIAAISVAVINAHRQVLLFSHPAKKWSLPTFRRQSCGMEWDEDNLNHRNIAESALKWEAALHLESVDRWTEEHDASYRLWIFATTDSSG